LVVKLTPLDICQLKRMFEAKPFQPICQIVLNLSDPLYNINKEEFR